MTIRLPLLVPIGLALLVLVVFIIVLSPLGGALFSSESDRKEHAIYATVTAIANPDASSPIDERPLTLPVLLPGDPCPLSKGSTAIVPREPYIFCSSCYWFGRGPVFFALSWNSDSEDATFSLDGVPYESGAYRAKTPWVSRLDYSGAIVVRGRQLDGSVKNKLSFSTGGDGPYEDLQLGAYGGPGESRWSFWPSIMWVPGPGCYGLQIDTMPGTDIVIFNTTKSEPTAVATPAP